MTSDILIKLHIDITKFLHYFYKSNKKGILGNYFCHSSKRKTVIEEKQEKFKNARSGHLIGIKFFFSTIVFYKVWDFKAKDSSFKMG